MVTGKVSCPNAYADSVNVIATVKNICTVFFIYRFSLSLAPQVYFPARSLWQSFLHCSYSQKSSTILLLAERKKPLQARICTPPAFKVQVKTFTSFSTKSPVLGCLRQFQAKPPQHQRPISKNEDLGMMWDAVTDIVLNQPSNIPTRVRAGLRRGKKGLWRRDGGGASAADMQSFGREIRGASGCTP